MPCPICRGTRFIRLPLYRGSNVTSRSCSYPCPECEPVPTSKPPGCEAFYCDYEVLDQYRDDPAYIASIKAGVASRIGRAMLDKGLIAFEEYRKPGEPARPLRASVYVVAKAFGNVSENRLDDSSVGFRQPSPPAVTVNVSAPPPQPKPKPKPEPSKGRFGGLIFNDEVPSK